MTSLAEALPKEINRVREIQNMYKSLRGMPNVIVEPQIMMMEQSLQSAIKACAEGNVIDMIKCYEDLKGYEE